MEGKSLNVREVWMKGHKCFLFSIAPVSENKTLQGGSWADPHEYIPHPPARIIVKSLSSLQNCQLSTSESNCKFEKQKQVKVKLSNPSQLNPFFTNKEPWFTAFMVWIWIETTGIKQQPQLCVSYVLPKWYRRDMDLNCHQVRGSLIFIQHHTWPRAGPSPVPESPGAFSQVQFTEVSTHP